MKIVISGGSGFLGSALARALLLQAHDVVVLTRNPGRARIGRAVAWSPPRLDGWAEEVASADVVINLAGENIGDARWTEERKRQLLASRLDATNAIVEAILRAPAGKRTLVSASAVGYYGLRGDEPLSEESPRGDGFLAELCERWESAARGAADAAAVTITRLGVVLEPSGGALRKMLLPFKLGVGGPIGSGRQWMSWVSRDDTVRALEWAAARTTGGVFNVTAPAPVQNREFTRALGRALHRPAILPVPPPALRLIFGQMADEALLGGQRVVPAALQRAGFSFHDPEIEPTLRKVLSSAR